ncbi:hypothetical protein N9L68_09250 [bacterium]|nr:hypothetical protein [bacterium]
MEIDTEIDTGTETEMIIYGDIVVANVATSPIRSRLAMVRSARREGARSVSRGPRQQWVPVVRLPSADDAGMAAVAADGAPEETAVAVGGELDEEAAVAARGEGAAPALEEAVHDAKLVCRLSDSEEERATQKGDDTIMKRIPSVTSLNDGDIIWSDADFAPVPDDAAVATGDDGDAVTRRSTRKPRGCTPQQQSLQSRWQARNDASHVGNIGWLFGNWGKRHGKMRKRLDKVLKRQPAMIIGISECQEESEEVLRRDPEERDPAAVAAAAQGRAKGKFKYRPEFKYLTLRGTENESVILAVRDEPGCALRMLDFERREAGLVNTKHNIKTHDILSQHGREGHLAAQCGLPRKRAQRHGGAHAQRARQQCPRATEARTFLGLAFGKDQDIRGASPDWRLQYVPLQGHTRTPQSRISD